MRRSFAALLLSMGVAAPVARGASGNDFQPLAPCRVLDTRLPAGPLGGPALQAGVARTFGLTGICGVPAGAVAVSLNATVTNTTAPGNLVLYAGDIAAPGTSNLSFSARQTRASASIVSLASDGTLKAVVGGGGADLILDVNGYFFSSAVPPTVTLDSVSDQTIPTNTTLSLRLSGHSTDALAALTYGLVSGPAGSAVSPLGVFSFAPNQTQMGAVPVTVQVHDGGGHGAQASFQVTVVDHDHPPVMGPLPDDLTRVGASYTKVLTATDPDPGDVLTFSLLSGPAGMTLSGQTLSWTPTSAQLGNWPVRVKVTDKAGLSASGQFNVGIQFLVATDDAYQVVLGQTLTVNAPGVLGNDLDPLAGPLTAAKLTNPDKGTLNSFNSDGSFVYQAPAILPGPLFDPIVKTHRDFAPGFFAWNPVIADLDGDGVPEIIVNHVSASGAGITAWHLVGGTLQVMWDVDGFRYPNGCIGPTAGVFEVAVGDIDDSGHPSIVFPAACLVDADVPARFMALNGLDGSVKWLSPPLGNARIDKVTLLPLPDNDPAGIPDGVAFGTVPTIARLRRGETPSIVVGAALSYTDFAGKPECNQLVPGWPTNTACRGAFVLDGKDGTVRQRMAAPASVGDRTTYGNGTQPAVVADLAGGGTSDIVFGGAVFGSDGAVKWNNPTLAAHGLTFWNGLGNFDDDPDVEIVRLDCDGNTFHAYPDRLAVFKADGRLLWSLPLPGTPYTGIPVVADVDGTGRPAVVFSVDGNVCAVDDRGNYKWCHDVGSISGVPNLGTSTRVQVYDLDGDGIPEVVVALKNQILLFLDGATGDVKLSFDMAAAIGPPLWSTAPDGLGGPVLADVDGSGHAAIVTLWGNSTRINIVSARNNDWRPARKIFNQASYYPGDVNDNGSIPLAFVNSFATPATNVFGNPAQVLAPVDPRLKSQTKFTYTAADGALTSAPGTVTIDILPPNRPPKFVSTPPTRWGVPFAPFNYTAQAVDPDVGDTVTYAIVLANGNSASNCTINSTSGAFNCPQLFSGAYGFVLTATDTQGAKAYQTVSLEQSSGSASVPDVVGQTQAAAGTILTGAGFATGAVTKISNAASAGQVLAQAPAAGASAFLGESVALTVSKGPAPPPPPPGPPPGLGNIKRIVVAPASTLHIVGENVSYKATAIYNDNTGADITASVVWSSSATAVATVSAGGVAHAAGPGTTLLTATAGGLSGQASLSVAARANGDSVLPVAAITQPASGGTVTGLTQILGTATDAHFLRYELALEASGDATFTLIGQGTTQVSNGILGTLDPTLLLNGAYTLRLTVYDANNNSTTADVPFVADGGQKVGTFTLTYTDMTLLLSGIPIQITRSYDSRDKHSGDFGVGWSMGIQALRISASGVQGTGWQVVQQGVSYALVPGNDHFISVTLPSGRVESFDLRVSPSTSVLAPFTTLFATFVPRPGTLGHLQSLDNVNLLILDPQPGPVTLVDDTTLNTFHPDQFLYTELDGTQFVVRRTTGVQSVKDTNGNQVTISAGGISHSTGTSIPFTRDASGRITRITDPKGLSRTYAYASAGDLASATDRAGGTSRYFYDAQHGLVRIEDPLGRSGVRCTYDDQGRLVSVTDGNGNTTTYIHDLAARVDQVIDALGRTTVVAYDDRGNVLSKTDPLGQTTTSTYDAGNNLLTRTDPLGHVTSWTYDARNSVLSQTDPLGHTTTFTRDAAGRELTSTDALGRTVATGYDSNGSVVGTTDALGHSTSASYDAAGNLTSFVDPTGATAANQYDGAGRRTQVTDPLGNATSLQYDANGFMLGQQAASLAPWGLTYDADGRILGTTVGTLSRSVARDASGAIASLTTSSGQTISISSDSAGHFTGAVDATGTPLRQLSYDAAGNVQATTDALGQQTVYSYDAANHMTSVTLADGSMIRMSYDAAGRPVQRTDAFGHVTLYQYDAADRAISTTDPAGGQTLFQYDAVGNLISRTDPAGHTTGYAYDAADRLVQTTFADGTTESTAYDAMGRAVQFTDAASHATVWTYDSLGRLSSTADPLGNTTTYQYVGAGPRTSVTDANGHTTTYAYDDHGRLVQTTHPLGDVETTTFDAAGNVLTSTNGAGETVQNQYDSQGRLAKVQRPDGTTFLYTYTADNLIASVRDARGLTIYTYDSVTRRVVRVTEPDGRYVRYGYDAGGNRTLVAQGGLAGAGELVTTYAYDVLNRLVRITNPSGGVTTQVWDAAGNLTSVTRPNGVTTTTTYDVRNRPVTIVSRDAGSTLLQQHSYSLDALGNRTRVDAFDGSHVDYQYDARGRVTRERHFDAASVLHLDLVYGYDPAGNLLTAGPAASPVTFAYDADNQLVSGGGVTYAYDLAGRRIQESFLQGAATVFRHYTWDAEDRLTSFQDTTGATTTYGYDDLGIRQAKGGATGPVTFLTDRSSATGFSEILREDTLSGTDTFVWGGQLLEAVEAGTPRFRLFDGLGSTRLLTGVSGTVTDSFDYAAYGTLLSHVGVSALRHRFAGEETDLESGLTYLRARYYDPRTGSFLTRDPATGNPYDPLSLHPYAYASGNPVNRTDPSGRETLIDLTITQAIDKINEKYQQIVQVKNAVVKTEKVIAAVMRDAGGILAVEAVIEAMGNPDLVLKWFGGILGLPLGAPHINLAELASASPALSSPEGEFFEMGVKASVGAIKVAAELALTKGAVSLFGGDDVTFQIEAVPAIQGGVLNNWHDPNSAGSRHCSANPNEHAIAAPGSDTYYVALCRPFFGDTPLPKTIDKVSMAGVMVHEFMHITSRRLIRDDAYNCAEHGFDPAKPGALKLVNLVPGKALFNADNYRCWVEESAIGSKSDIGGRLKK